MATTPAPVRPTREQLKTMFRGRVITWMAPKIQRANTPDTAREVALAMFAVIERHGWRFYTRGELEPAAPEPKVSKTITFQRDREGQATGAVVQEW